MVLRVFSLSRRLTTRKPTSYFSLLRPLPAVHRPFPPSLPPLYQRFLFSTKSDDDSVSDYSGDPPPPETMPLPGCDFEHWLVVTYPTSLLTRDQIIDKYIRTLASVVGSEDEARSRIYSVSTRYYFAFGALVSEYDLLCKLRGRPEVEYVLPDCYLDVAKKDYGGEPFINGQAVSYHPKYHALWGKTK